MTGVHSQVCGFSELQSLCIGIADCHHSTPNWTDTGKIVVRSENVKGGRILLADASHTDDATFQTRISRSVPEPGDLIVTREAPMGEVGMIPDGVECCLGQRLVLVKPDPSKVDRHYLLYAMQSEFVQRQIRTRDQTGSTVSNLRIPALKELRIPMLQDAEQIGAVLAALDAKIDLNNRINRELEALAKTIYDYWFVRFDFPFDFAMGRPDTHGRPYKSSGGAMVWNDTLKREIPAGWTAVALRTLVDCNANTYGENNLPNRIVYLDTSNLTENRLGGVEEYNARTDEVPSRARRIVSSGDVLYSTVRPNQHHHGIIKQVVDDLVVSTGFVVLTCADPDLNGDLIYMFIRSDEVTTKMRRIAESSRSSYPSVAPDDLLDLRLALPRDRTQVSKVCGFFDQIFMKIWITEKENRELTQLRDWLLPLLMNGQVRVTS